MTKSTGEAWIGVPALAKELGVTDADPPQIVDSGDVPAYKFGRVIRIKRRMSRRSWSPRRSGPVSAPPVPAG